MRITPAAWAAAAVLLLAGAGSAAAIESNAERDAARAARAQAKTSIVVFDGALGSLTRTIGIVEVLTERQAPASRVEDLLSGSGIVAIARVRPGDTEASVITGRIPRGATPALIVSGTTLARQSAMDTGESHTVVPARGTVAVVVPAYTTGAKTGTTDERRAALRHWVIATMDAPAFLTRIGLTGDSAQLAVDGVVAGGSAVSSADGVEVAVARPVANSTWHLRVRPPMPSGFATTTKAMAAATLLAALTALAVGWRDRTALDRLRASHDALLRETRIVAELGPILQTSLDLGEVLPAVAVRLCDEFGLVSVALELTGDEGNLVEVFSMGTRPADRLVPGAVPASELVCPLVRAGRTIGRLRAIPGTPLTESDITAIRAGAELVAVATSNVELYEREQANVRRLTELDRLKDAFLGTISHELRTPITAIRGFVQLLCERWGDFGDEDRLEFLRRIQRNSVSLGLLVDDLLDFARLERQSIVVTPIGVRLDLAAGSLVRQLTPLLGQHHLVTHIDTEVEAVADVSALDRVLANLLTNAAKFSPPASTIEVATRVADGWAELSVSDQGPGIPVEDRQRVFTRFYRGDGAVARATRGAGIGLSVVRELVVQMGGEIAVEANEPQGTRMVVRLPLSTGVTPEVVIPDQISALPPSLPARRNS